MQTQPNVLTVARRPLGQVDPKAVRDIVRRVLDAHLDQRTVPAAKFSSFI